MNHTPSSLLNCQPSTFTLNGSWFVQQVGQAEIFPATVPGCVHTDLLAAGRIPDPFYRANELETLWLGENDWLYWREFELPADFLAHKRLLLRCTGLDTLASLFLNGQLLGTTDNMFRTWEFEVRQCLRPGRNKLEIRFDSALAYGRQKQAERFLPAWTADKLPGGNWLRKEPCNFGWDWGPKVVTCGIWRDIELLALDHPRLTDLSIEQQHLTNGVNLTITATTEAPSPADVRLTVWLGDELLAEKVTKVGVPAGIPIPNPQLWWPNGLGRQPLYQVVAELVADGQLLDRQSRRIGLRTLVLDRQADQWGESFQFVVNGRPFFAKGANWIPADAFLTRLTPDHYARLLSDAAAANMNMLRVWGGGIYEADCFYDRCDELGICLWQDFIFACATYPTFDPQWLDNVAHEAQENIRRLRHHPAIALWCGNNELEQGLVGPAWTTFCMNWEDYGRLFDQLLPQLVAQHDPQRDYWPGSPHSPHGERANSNDPRWGDAHLWSVWHGKEPFEWYRTCEHRFNSEFGFQSFPEPRTVYAFTRPEDRNLTSYVMEHHQRSGIGNQTIIHYLLDWFRLPISFDMLLWLSQIVQGMAMTYAVEHWRRSMPRGMGTLYWQLNDCWPVASWSSLDYFGRWKALHFMAKRFYAPLLISGLEDWAAGTVEIHLTSDLPAGTTAQVQWLLTTADGQPLAQDSLTVTIPAGQNQPITVLDANPYLSRYTPRNLLLWLYLEVDGQMAASNLVLFARPKHLELADPRLQCQVEPLGPAQYRLTLTCERAALWAWLAFQQLEVGLSDNFVHLRPGQPTPIIATVTDDPGRAALANDLRLHSLFDTF